MRNEFNLHDRPWKQLTEKNQWGMISSAWQTPRASPNSLHGLCSLLLLALHSPPSAYSNISHFTIQNGVFVIQTKSRWSFSSFTSLICTPIRWGIFDLGLPILLVLAASLRFIRMYEIKILKMKTRNESTPLEFVHFHTQQSRKSP